MFLRKKNIFGFATIAATVTLSAAIFATGCGDSGDSSNLNPLNPDKIANAIVLDYDDTVEAALLTSKAKYLRWIVTDGSGKQVAIRKATAQKINFSSTTTTANAALAEDSANSDDTVTDTTTSSANNNRCYVVLNIPSSVFQGIDNVTVSAIYYDANDHVVGFGSTVNGVEWNKGDKTEKRYNGTAQGNFFPEKDAQYSLTASPEFINKYDEELAKKDPKATQDDAFTTLAFDVTNGAITTNIIGLVDVEVADDDYYIKPANNGIVGSYQGVNFTEGGVRVNATVEKDKGCDYTFVYVTDRTLKSFSIVPDYDYEKTLLVPDKISSVDYSLGQEYITGYTEGTAVKQNAKRGVRVLPLRIGDTQWSDGEGEAPHIFELNERFNLKVQDSANKEIKDTSVENGVVKFNQDKLDAAIPFTVVGTYTGTTASGKMEGGQAIPTKVEVGFAENASATEFATEVKGDSSKEVSTSYKMYARFATELLGGFTSNLFEVPESTGFVYPQAKLFKDNADYTGTTVTVADNQKKNDYKVTIAKDNQDTDLEVKMGKDDAAQKAAFSPYVDVNFAGLKVVAPSQAIGNEDTEAGDEP